MRSHLRPSPINTFLRPISRRLSPGRLLLWSTLIFLISPAALSLAHNPVWNQADRDRQVPDTAGSYAWYQETADGSQPDVFTIEAEAGQRLQAAVLIPRIPGLEGFEVNMVLLGPGLPPISARDLPEGTVLPDGQDFGPVCEGTGSGLVVESAVGEEFFNRFTQTGYTRAQQLDVELTDTGTYYLILAATGGGPGKYVLETGEHRSFDAGQWLSFPIDWVRVHLYFGHGEWLIGGLVVVLAAMASGFVAIHRRRLSRRK